jgi:hypothetical protein
LSSVEHNLSYAVISFDIDDVSVLGYDGGALRLPYPFIKGIFTADILCVVVSVGDIVK